MGGHSRNTLLLEAENKMQTGWNNPAAGIFAEGASKVLIQGGEKDTNTITIKAVADAGTSAGVYASGKGADVRILLIADPTDRLARRAMERHGAADEKSLEATRDEVIRRDTQDSTVSEFMSAHEGVVTLDNSGMVPDETFAAALAIIEDRVR